MNHTTWYLVRRTAWDTGYRHPFSVSESGQGSYSNDTLGVGYVPVVMFRTEREARAEAHRLNLEVRRDRGPFWFSDEWEDLTDLSLDEAAVRLVRKGLPPPPPKHHEDAADDTWRTLPLWREWWDRESVNWTVEQLADAWAVFPKLRFYDVVEIEVED